MEYLKAEDSRMLHPFASWQVAAEACEFLVVVEQRHSLVLENASEYDWWKNQKRQFIN